MLVLNYVTVIQIMASLLPKILELSGHSGFLKLVLKNKSVDHYKFFPAGELLCQNIQNEWIYSNVISRDENNFLFHSGESCCSSTAGLMFFQVMPILSLKLCSNVDIKARVFFSEEDRWGKSHRWIIFRWRTFFGLQKYSYSVILWE